MLKVLKLFRHKFKQATCQPTRNLLNPNLFNPMSFCVGLTGPCWKFPAPIIFMIVRGKCHFDMQCLLCSQNILQIRVFYYVDALRV